jgi:hypothetical protein
MAWGAAHVVRLKENDRIARAARPEWGFRGGGRAQIPSLPMDDPLTSDKRGVCLPYAQCLETVLNLPLPGIVRMSCFGRLSPLPTP